MELRRAPATLPHCHGVTHALTMQVVGPAVVGLGVVGLGAVGSGVVGPVVVGSGVVGPGAISPTAVVQEWLVWVLNSRRQQIPSLDAHPLLLSNTPPVVKHETLHLMTGSLLYAARQNGTDGQSMRL